MATKFKSKYTAEEIEVLLDSIGSSMKGAIIPVDELPIIENANASSFYLYDGKLYFVDNGEWQEVVGGSGSREEEITIKDVEDLDQLALMFTDFSIKEDEVHFELNPESFSHQTIYALKEAMLIKGQPYYVIKGLKAIGFLENAGVEEGESECLYCEGAYNGGYFYIYMTMVDGSEIKITEEEADTYLINYVGYAL